MTAFDDAVAKIDKVIIRARRMGIRVYAKVAHMTDLNPIGYDQAYGWQADMICTAASINKLLIARYRLGGDPYAPFSWTDEYVRPGGGLYDEPGAPHSGTGMTLMRDMLARSGNTAMVVLGRGEVDEINRLADQAWRYYPTGQKDVHRLIVSRLLPRDNGFFETGSTTPEEALGMIISFLGLAPFGPMITIAQNALVSSLSHIPTPHGVEIASKHGELNGPDNDGVFVRNEVGRINAFTPDLAAYAIFTESDTLFKAKIAEMVIGQIGALLMEITGSRTSTAARLIGKTAFNN